MSTIFEHLETAKEESLFPQREERPCYIVLDERAKYASRKYKPGVYSCRIEQTKGGDNSEPGLVEQWICSPLHVDAITFDGQGNNFGRLLRFRPTTGNWREWAMPMDMLRGSGEELRGELLSMGVELDPYTAKRELTVYLQKEHPKRHVHCAVQVGWCKDQFVLPDTVIGPDPDGVIFQTGEKSHDEYTTAGDLESWKREIAAKAVGNPTLLLSLSAAFAGPLLAKCHQDGGGIHWVGDSSTGKTTLIEAACSVWGGDSYRRSWKATSNGMEGAAATFNDGLLALDEISECDPREVGAIVYALGNGRGKQRASRSGRARAITRWRCFIISSGERTISTTIKEGGNRAKAGQSVRVLDIPVARTYGAWDSLHNSQNGAAFSDAIKQAATTHHGIAGRAYLKKLTQDNTDFPAKLEAVKALPLFTVSDGEGQHKRTAARFALVAMAGELATEYGLTGWGVGGAAKAAAECFQWWLSSRSKGNDERRQILEAVSAFIDLHGDSRFSDANNTNDRDPRTNNRAGWWEETTKGRIYLFNSTGMREALKGFDFKRALDELQEAGALEAPGSDGKRAKFKRIAGHGKKLYPINPEKLEAGEQ